MCFLLPSAFAAGAGYRGHSANRRAEVGVLAKDRFTCMARRPRLGGGSRGFDSGLDPQTPNDGLELHDGRSER